MRIAHVVGTFYPHIGGMGQVALDECRALAKRGHQVEVFTMRYTGFVAHEVVDNITITRIKPLIKSGDAGWMPQLFFQLKNFDIVHLHYPLYGGAEFVWLAKKLRGQKYIVTYHMDAEPIQWYQKMIKCVYDATGVSTILKNAKKIVVVDKSYFQSNQKMRSGALVSSKTIEIPNGIDTSIFYSDFKIEPQKELLFVGNLMPVKGLDILLEACTALPEAKLTVVGSGYAESRYKKISHDYGLGKRVAFIGSVPHNTLPNYYRRAWCTIVPSLAESFSLVTLESLACGTPVIASRLPSIENKIEHGRDGLLFTPGSIEDLKQTIEKFLQLPDQDKKAMGERGTAKVEAKYSLEKHVDSLEKIYASV